MHPPERGVPEVPAIDAETEDIENLIGEPVQEDFGFSNLTFEDDAEVDPADGEVEA